MLIYILHFLLGVAYILQFPSNIFLVGIVYFVHLIPPLHRRTIYYITEFKIPPWSIALKCMIHISLFENFHQKINIMMLWMLIYCWNDLYFVVCHAEKRLAKIDDLLQDHTMRLAHLYHDTYADDTKNRFHKHLFDTNRLYWFDKTDESNRISLGIHNYRKIMRPINPKAMLVKAASGKSIFLSNRHLIHVPALFLFVFFGFIDFRFHYLTFLNAFIVFSELFRIVVSTKHLYILGHIVLASSVLVANHFGNVYLIEPINTD